MDRKPFIYSLIYIEVYILYLTQVSSYWRLKKLRTSVTLHFSPSVPSHVNVLLKWCIFCSGSLEWVWWILHQYNLYFHRTFQANFLFPRPSHVSRPSGESSALCSGGSRFDRDTPIISTVVSRGFPLSHSSHIYGQYFKVAHGRFLVHCFQFIVHCHQIIRCYMILWVMTSCNLMMETVCCVETAVPSHHTMPWCNITPACVFVYAIYQ
jgi:hypothetical protein